MTSDDRTLRIYYHDATLCRFSARLKARQPVIGSDGLAHPAVQLDQTAFYPTSGGQPYDTGLLGGQRVVDVVEDGNGEIWHLLAAALDETVERVQGEVDWDRRFDHMQQHSGQHLLSAAFEELFAAPTVGFHLGSASSTIDLEMDDLSWASASRVEAAVNRVVWDNRPVSVQVIDPAALHDVPLRKPPAVEGKVRVVWVDGYDASACGGTHVRRTGEVGLIKITAIERYKGGVRVHFVCGGRALRDYQRVLDLVQVASLALTVGQDDLPEAIERIVTDAKDVRRQVSQVREALLAYEADAFWQAAQVIGEQRIIVAHWAEHTFDDARTVASRLVTHPKTVVFLAVTAEKGMRLVCACSDDLPTVDARALLRVAAASLGGRGGGSPTLAQGGTPHHDPDDVVAALHQAVSGEVR
jgi:alanyl-tRNA synthetase